MKDFQLNEGESLIELAKGDYWGNIFLFLYEQSSGDIMITDKRVLFFTRLLGTSVLNVEIDRSNIETVEKCNVGSIIPWNPTGIKIHLKDGKNYKFGSMKRERIIEALGV